MSLCLGCERPLPQPFLDLGETPLANAYLSADRLGQPEPKYRLAVAYCPECHLVQLTDVVTPEELFSEYLYFSSYSETFLRHAEAMAADLIDRFKLTPRSRVLEIASNDGYLLQYFQKQNIPCLGIEPAQNIAAIAIANGVPTLAVFFGADTAAEIADSFGKSDVIIGNNVLAHVPDVNGFLKAVHACLCPEGAAVFEFPWVRHLIEKSEFDTIYHEHVFYYSLAAIGKLAERAGLELYDAQPQTVHGGTLRTFIQYPGKRPRTEALARLMEEEAEDGLTSAARYRDFAEKVISNREELRKLSTFRSQGKRIVAYGAPAKGNTLLNYCGIGSDVIDFTVDRSPHKQGLFLPGTHLPIRSPEEIRKERPDYLLILPWNIKDEIMAQMAYVREWGCRFIIPIPEVEVIG